VGLGAVSPTVLTDTGGTSQNHILGGVNLFSKKYEKRNNPYNLDIFAYAFKVYVSYLALQYVFFGFLFIWTAEDTEVKLSNLHKFGKYGKEIVEKS